MALCKTRSRHECHLDLTSLRFSDVLIEIFVGKYSQSFRISKHLLCAKSEFFNAALNGRFAEAHNNELTLPEEDTVEFNSFKNWLYYGHLDLYPHRRLSEAQLEELWAEYFRLYLLAEKLIIPDLQNDVVSDMIALSELASMPLGEAQCAFDQTGSNSGLHRLIVDHFVGRGPLSCWIREEKVTSQSFMFAIAEGFSQVMLIDEVGIEKDFPAACEA